MSKIHFQVNSIDGIVATKFGGGYGGGSKKKKKRNYPSHHPMSQAQKADASQDPETVKRTREYAVNGFCAGAAGVAGGAAGVATAAATKNPTVSWGAGATVGSIVNDACQDLFD